LIHVIAPPGYWHNNPLHERLPGRFPGAQLDNFSVYQSQSSLTHLVTLLQSLEEAFGSSTVSSDLVIDIYNFPVLINRTPEVVLLFIDFNEDLINIEVNIEVIFKVSPVSVIMTAATYEESIHEVQSCHCHCHCPGNECFNGTHIRSSSK